MRNSDVDQNHDLFIARQWNDFLNSHVPYQKTKAWWVVLRFSLKDLTVDLKSVFIAV